DASLEVSGGPDTSFIIKVSTLCGSTDCTESAAGSGVCNINMRHTKRIYDNDQELKFMKNPLRHPA
ncbi:MAG TPA: hypothetical protein PK986_08565, partial [Spirochaetota bacterium]|nr:hypothetical protein [Spirochaetota bacterium]